MTEKKKKITTVVCPICKKKSTWEENPYKPFCSERCKLIDLGKWASEDYRIAGKKKDIPEGEPGEKNDVER